MQLQQLLLLLLLLLLVLLLLLGLVLPMGWVLFDAGCSPPPPRRAKTP